MSSGSVLSKILLTFVFEMNVYVGAWCECICMCVYLSNNWLVTCLRLFLLFTHLLFFIFFLTMSDYQTDNITIATVNCQGLATPDKRKDVINYYKQQQFSIICLQDTHFITVHEALIESQWGYKCYFNSYMSNSRGVCILFNNNFEFKVHAEKKIVVVIYLL